MAPKSGRSKSSRFMESASTTVESIRHAAHRTAGRLLLIGSGLLVVTLILQALVSTDVARSIVLTNSADFFQSTKASLHHLTTRPIEIFPLLFQIGLVLGTTLAILKQLGSWSLQIEQSDKGSLFLQEQLRIITEGSDHGIFLASPDGVVRYLNPWLADKGRRTVGEKWLDLLNCTNEPEVAELWASVTTELRIISFPFYLQNPQRLCMCKLVPVVRSGKVYGIVGFVRNETSTAHVAERVAVERLVEPVHPPVTDDHLLGIQNSIAALREESAAHDQFLRDEFNEFAISIRNDLKRTQEALQAKVSRASKRTKRPRKDTRHTDHEMILSVLRLEQRIDRLAKRHDRRIGILIDSLSTLVSSGLRSSETQIIEAQDLDPLNRLVKLHRASEHRPRNRSR